MSGTKYAPPSLALIVMEEIIAERQRYSALEAARRAEEEANERKKRLEAMRTRCLLELRDAFVSLQQEDSLRAEDAAQLRAEADRIHAALTAAQTLQQISDAARPTSRLLYEIKIAMGNKSWQDQQGAEQEVRRFPAELTHWERSFDAIASAESAQFDATGQANAQQALANARAALAAGEPQTIRRALDAARESVQKHATHVLHAREIWQQQHATAEHALAETHALLAGLKSDPVVTRWHSRSLAELETETRAAEKALAAGIFEASAQLWKQAEEKAARMVAEANAAQIKADQRDYITRSIGNSLEAMGFVVGNAQPEYPGHPATALIVRAATPAGKGISVSVPMDGQIWYDVDGYPKTTESAVGGGTAAVCDEAEQVLNEMHEKLEAEFGVRMGELQWEGKDPNRVLRKAEQLPTGEVRTRVETRR